VMPVDVCDSRIEPSLGVETVKPEAWFDQMRVGDVDKFHRQIGSAIFWLCKGWRWLAPKAACNPAWVGAIWHEV